MLLRLGLLHKDLAKRFNISASLSVKIFYAWLDATAKTLGKTVSKSVKATMPERVHRLPDLRAIIYCSEIMIQTPKDPILQTSLGIITNITVQSNF